MKKKYIILFIFCFLPFISILAQKDGNDSLRRKYVNLSFSKVEMKRDLLPDLKSNYGAAFSVGRTYFVHRKPIAGMIRIGIDATWFDLNYTNYKVEYRNPSDNETLNYHQAEIGMQVGPSVTVNPISKLNVHGYFRYAPSFSGLYMDDTFYGNYATFFTAGGAVSFGAAGLGLEARWGNCKYKELIAGEEEEGTSGSSKTTFSGLRAYLTFRF